MPATPASFRLTQSPLGAVLLPQALTSVISSRHREKFPLAQVWWEFPRLSSIPIPSLSSSRNPKHDVSLVELPGLANALTTRRQAKVCLRPLSSYGADRASRPPSTPAPGPHISGIAPAFAGPWPRQPTDCSAAFSVTGEAPLRQNVNALLCRCVFLPPRGSRTSI
jgi:hypothetical protein